MKRHRSHRDGPGARIQSTNRPVFVGNVEVIGRKARILAKVKRSARWDAHFAELCGSLGLDVRMVQDHGWNAVYDVTGTVEALEECVADTIVVDWNYALDAKGPR